MSGELWLFLSAGMLATGLGHAFAAFELTLPFTHFGPLAASAVLAMVLLIAALGLHPVIALSSLVPLLLPLDPVPEMLVVLCASSWAIGCGICPYAGTNLIVQGRFGHDTWQLARRGYVQAVLMWAVCSVAFAALYWLAD